jgi:hypothetical protein
MTFVDTDLVNSATVAELAVVTAEYRLVVERDAPPSLQQVAVSVAVDRG